MTEIVDPPVVSAPVNPPAPAAPPSDELPAWVRTKLSEVNQEAAGYRVQLRETELARAALTEQVVSLTAEKASTATALNAVQADFDKLATAVTALVPDQNIFVFAKTLQGNTSDELATHATELQSLFAASAQPSSAVDRSQGLGSTGVATDPASQFAALIQSHLK